MTPDPVLSAVFIATITMALEPWQWSWEWLKRNPKSPAAPSATTNPPPASAGLGAYANIAAPLGNHPTEEIIHPMPPEIRKTLAMWSIHAYISGCIHREHLEHTHEQIQQCTSIKKALAPQADPNSLICPTSGLKRWELN